MNLLVTGGAGYVGSQFTRHALAAGHDVWVLDNLSSGNAASAPLERLVVGDVHDESLVRRLLVEREIDAVVHFAAACGQRDETSAERCYGNNVLGSLRLLSTMRACGVRRIVFSSSGDVYGAPQRIPIAESEPPHPTTALGRSQLAVEWALRDYGASHGFRYAALRYFEAAGADDSGEHGEDHRPETHLIPQVAAVALGRRSHVEIAGHDYFTPDGTLVRDYVHVMDLAEAHLLALEALESHPALCLNLGAGLGSSVREVIATCEEIMHTRVSVAYGPRRPAVAAQLVADATKARDVLGWEPRRSHLWTIVESAWQWHAAHPDGYTTSQAVDGVAREAFSRG